MFVLLCTYIIWLFICICKIDVDNYFFLNINTFYTKGSTQSFDWPLRVALFTFYYFYISFLIIVLVIFYSTFSWCLGRDEGKIYFLLFFFGIYYFCLILDFGKGSSFIRVVWFFALLALVFEFVNLFSSVISLKNLTRLLCYIGVNVMFFMGFQNSL